MTSLGKGIEELSVDTAAIASPPLPPAKGFSGRALGTFSALAYPDFRTLWVGSILYTGAYFVDAVARPWLAYNISGSGLLLGTVALASGATQVLSGLVGGVAADRFDKRRVLIFAHASLSTISLVNALVVYFGIVQLWHLVIFALLQGAVAPLSYPARQAYIPELVEKPHLANAIAMDASGKNTIRVLNTALAGLLLAWNPSTAFFAITALNIAATLTVLRLPKSQTDHRSNGGALVEVWSGFSYLWARPLLRSLVAMALVPTVGMSYQQLLPIFQSKVLHVPPSHLGLMFTAIGIGSLVGSLSITRLATYRRPGLAQIIAGIACGLSLLLFALSGTYESSLVLLFVVGLTFTFYFTMNSVQLMSNAAPEFQGRVMAIYSITWCVGPVATLPMGAMVDIAGAPATVAAVGAIIALFFVATVACYRSFWRSSPKSRG